MYKKNLLLIVKVLSLISMFVSCSKNKSDVFPTDLHVTLKSKNQINLSNAIVALFDNEQTYLKSSKTFSTSGAYRVDTTLNNSCIFKGIDEKKIYWVAAYYKDYVAFPDTFIYLDNSITQYVLINKLSSGSLSYITLDLTPAEGIVTFYAGDSLPSTLPIHVKVDSDSLGGISQVLALKPSPFAKQSITLKVRRGTHVYSAKNSSGCSSIDSFNIVGGDLKVFNINKCVSGFVAFWTNVTSLVSPIDITINSNIKLTPLNVTSGTAPASCISTQTVYHSLPPGIHTYLATTTGLAWAGTFTINGTGCSPENIIQLIQP